MIVHALLLCAMLVQAPATDPPPVVVRSEVRPQDSVWVGQRTSIYVTVAIAGQPDRSPRLALQEVSGALFRQAPGSPLLGSEDERGTSYTTQRFELLLFPQRAGELQVLSTQVEVDLDGVTHTVDSPAHTVTARLPDGVEPGSSLITTARLEVEQRWVPDAGRLQVGDAFVREITVRADDLLGVAVPPAPVARPAGLAAYPGDPTTSDTMQRGQLACTRVDSVTYVCTEPGTIELPELTYRWWNPQRQTLESRTLEGRSLEVAEAPAVAARSDGTESPSRGWLTLPAVAGGLVLLLALGSALLARRRIGDALARRRAAYAASEPGRFRALQRACRAHDAHAAWPALAAWREAHDAQLSRSHADALTRAAEALQRALIGLDPSWDGSALGAGTGELRRTLRRELRARRRAGSANLPRLNPR